MNDILDDIRRINDNLRKAALDAHIKVHKQQMTVVVIAGKVYSKPVEQGIFPIMIAEDEQ